MKKLHRSSRDVAKIFLCKHRTILARKEIYGDLGPSATDVMDNKAKLTPNFYISNVTSYNAEEDKIVKRLEGDNVNNKARSLAVMLVQLGVGRGRQLPDLTSA